MAEFKGIHVLLVEQTVYKENFAPILFSPFSPSDMRTNLELG